MNLEPREPDRSVLDAILVGFVIVMFVILYIAFQPGV